MGARPLIPRIRVRQGEISQAAGDTLVQTEDRYLGGGDFGRPQDLCETCRNGDLLRPFIGIGNNAATDRTADFLAPQFPSVRRVERVEIATHVAEKDDTAGGR